MKKVWFLFLLLLAFVTVGAPFSRADSIVDISVVNVTFPGSHGPEVFSANFEYDNTTETILLATTTTNETGEIRDFSFDKAFQGQIIWSAPEGSIIFGAVPSTGVILPGVYGTELALGTDDPDFGFHEIASATVIVTHEPSTCAVILGTALVILVMKWKTLLH